MNSALRHLYETEIEFDAEQEAGEARRLALHADEFGKPIRRAHALRKAKDIAADALRVATSGATLEERRDQLATLCETMGVPYPESDYGHAPEIARLSAVEWWGKRLRVTDWRKYEARQIRLGQIDRYCSDEIASAYVHHQQDIRTLLDGLIAFREDGEAAFTLKELADKSKSNPAVRRAAMIHQVKGMAEIAYDNGWSWAFWTLTCPSRFHRSTTIGKGKSAKKIPNQNWDGSLPREAQQHLTSTWAKIRAKLKRLGIACMFMRVAEPHTDGCPHWHGIFWAKPENLKRIAAVVREYALQVDGAEPGAQRHRVRWLKYRPWAAKNVEGLDARAKEINACIGYMVAYIGKNIDGKRADDSSMGSTTDRNRQVIAGDAVDNAVRAVAWASLWGIRQFQFGGCERSGPYEELRRLRTSIDDDELEEARKAADAGDFAGYSSVARQLELTLWQETSADRIAALAAAKGLPLEATPELADAVVAADLLNKWGEPTRRWVMGVRAGTNEFQREKTRLHTWKVVAREEVKAVAASMGEAGRRLLDVLQSRTDAMQRAAGETVARLLSAFSRSAKPSALGPGSITVRDSGQGLPTAGPDPGPPDHDDAAAWYFIDHFGIEQAAF